MRIGIRKLWNTYKNIAAGRGLLQWIGWWPWAVAAVSAVGTWLSAWIKHLAGPEQFVLDRLWQIGLLGIREQANLHCHE
jgi:hypothetical protein